MKTMRVFCLVLCLCLVIPAVPVNIMAAQSNRSLQTGRSYAFTNSDTRTISYVTFGSGIRYEYISLDSFGEVLDFGVSTGRVPVRGGGSTVITPLSSASASYDAAKIAVSESDGAALTRVSLLSGETVSIENNHSEPLNIAVDNSGRAEYAQYDCVAFDRYGMSAFLADACRYTQMAVPASGMAYFTAGEGGLTLMFPSSWAGAEIQTGSVDHPALKRMPLHFGRTYALLNTSQALDCSVQAAAGGLFAYDYVTLDAFGYTDSYGHAVQDKSITVEAGRVLYITPVKRSTSGSTGGYGVDSTEGVTLVYPYSWTGILNITEGGNGALVSYPVAVGSTLSVKNTSANTPFTFRADSAAPVSLLDYTYTGGPFNETGSVTEMPFTEMTVGAGDTWTFTVKKGAPLTLWLPSAWLSAGLSIGGSSQPALEGYILEPGRSIKVENASPSLAFDINLQSARAGFNFHYDYMTEDEWDTLYGVEVSEEVLTLPPASVTYITAGNFQPVTVQLPSSSLVSAKETAVPAMTSFPLESGTSLSVENNTERSLRFSFYSLQAQMADFVLTDEEGEITDFGVTAISEPFTVDAGSRVLFTNSETQPIQLICPPVWLEEGLTVSPSEEQALYRHNLKENQPLNIVNMDKKYDRAVKIEPTTAAQGLNAKTGAKVVYDYVLTNSKQSVEDYGVAGEGLLTLYGGGSSVIMPQKGVSLTVCYPAGWNNASVKCMEADNEPLYRVILKPDKKLTLNNNSKLAYAIQNSSMGESGRYYLTEGNARINTKEAPLSGIIEVPARTSVSITAATGSDLEIWMPWEWGKALVNAR